MQSKVVVFFSFVVASSLVVLPALANEGTDVTLQITAASADHGVEVARQYAGSITVESPGSPCSIVLDHAASFFSFDEDGTVSGSFEGSAFHGFGACFLDPLTNRFIVQFSGHWSDGALEAHTL